MDFTLIVLSILSLLTPSCNASSSQAAEWTETTVPNYSDSEQSLTLPSSLPTPGSDVDRFIRDEIDEPHAEELKKRRVGTSASAITVPFLHQMRNPFVQDLVGCTSLLIISESGAWISHFWEQPAIIGIDSVFQEQVIDPIEKGDGNRMPSPFPLGAPDGILGPTTNPEVLIFSPKDEVTGILAHEDKMIRIERALTGPGKPFEGVQTSTWVYTKQKNSDKEKALGKVLVQYSPNQVDDSENPPTEQEAIYRVWFEGRQILEHRWVASRAQRVLNNYPTGRPAMPPHTVTSISDRITNPGMRMSYDDGLDVWCELCQHHNTHEECRGANIGNSLFSVEIRGYLDVPYWLPSNGC